MPLKYIVGAKGSGMTLFMTGFLKEKKRIENPMIFEIFIFENYPEAPANFELKKIVVKKRKY